MGLSQINHGGGGGYSFTKVPESRDVYIHVGQHQQILEEGLAGLDMAWPESEVKHEYGKYGQPLCRECKELCLDYSTIWGNLDYILHQGASEKEFFNGIRDRGRTPGMTLADFMKLGEVQMAGFSGAQSVAMR